MILRSLLLLFLIRIAAPAAPPNIVLILSDDMGFSDIGCYGSEIETPVLDGLAAKGLRFTQFYNTGRCCPTRASLLTGLYPHQAGIGHMIDGWSPRLGEGYAGDLNRNCRTIAEALKPAGYMSYASGKWHVAADIKPEGPKHNWPLQRGFDRFYGTIIGAGSFFDPGTLTRDNQAISPYADPEYKPEQYYYTDAINDHAVRFIKEHEQDTPFFLYVAHTAAHWPMQALEQDIAKYKGRYDAGYAKVREARVAKLKKLGLLPDHWDVTPIKSNWDQAANKQWDARNMEVYAAMVDCMDRGIGRIVEALKRKGLYENTLVLYLQDNGGCAEGVGRRGNETRKEKPSLKVMPAEQLIQDVHPKRTRAGWPMLHGPKAPAGPDDTYIAYGQAWANVSNTPFREYKHWVHEGGAATPLIAHWPKGIPASRHGKFEHQSGHLIDLMATFVDLAGAKYPAEVDGKNIHPLEGVSLRPAFAGGSLERAGPIFWEHEGNRAVRDGTWKLVAKGPQGAWELYDMERDRTEMHDLAKAEPGRVEKMARQWEVWAKRAKVLPWPWKTRQQPAGVSKKMRFVLKQGEVLKELPDTGRRGFAVVAEISRPGKGVILAQGGVAHGFALYVNPDGRPCVALRLDGDLRTFAATSGLPGGPCTLTLQLNGNGRLTLKTGDGELIAAAAEPLRRTPADACSAGLDSNDPVGNYPRESRFTGVLDSVVLELAK